MLDGISHLSTQERIIASSVTLETLPEELFQSVILFVPINQIGNLIYTSRHMKERGNAIRDTIVRDLIHYAHCTANPMETRYYTAMKLCKIWLNLAKQQLNENVSFLFRNFFGRGEIPYRVGRGFYMYARLGYISNTLEYTLLLGEGSYLNTNTLDELDPGARVRIRIAERQAKAEGSELDQVAKDRIEEDYLRRYLFIDTSD